MFRAYRRLLLVASVVPASAGVALSTNALLGHAQSPAAGSAPLRSYERSGSSRPLGTAAARAVTAYWTPQRMRTAIPVEAQGPSAAGPSSPVPTRLGPPASVPPLPPSLGNAPPPILREAARRDIYSGSSFASGGAAFKYPFPFDSFKVPQALRGAYPYDNYGKIFFTNAKNGKNFVCSGAVVNSGQGGNGSTVVTAGHCVVGGGSGATSAAANWFTNEAFCPNYQGTVGGVKQCPQGLWTSRGSFSISGWFRHHSFQWDVGALVLNQLAGKTIQDTLGSQGLKWNEPKPEEFLAFGWPAAAPYTGLDLVQCDASTADVDVKAKPNLGIGCDMTGGSSGGPWLINWDPATGGWVDGVNSYKYAVAQPLAMYSPYFTDDNVARVYNAARVA